MTRRSPRVHERSRTRCGGAGLLAAALLLAVAPSRGAAQPAPLTFEYVYPYNTPELTENHLIVLDTAGAEPRGWYYGTSDEFDQAREGYLPGFFVAPMTDLVLTPTTIAFTIARPERFFASPVPLEHRDPDAVPPGRLAEWDVPLPITSRSYGGTIDGDRITLDVPGGARVFLRR